MTAGGYTCQMGRILVVDDDPDIRTSIRRALVLDGHDVAMAVDGRDALRQLLDDQFAGIVLDVEMPHVDGLEVCRRLREAGDLTPIIVLTARAEVDDRVSGLDAGADDYLTKPFAVAELQARVRAMTRWERRRSNEGGGDAEHLLTFGRIVLDLDAYELRAGDRSWTLSRTEFALMELLMRNPRRVLTRDLIHDRVWGYDFGAASNSLEVYVGYLRRKLEHDGTPRVLQTVRGVGYVLRGGDG